MDLIVFLSKEEGNPFLFTTQIGSIYWKIYVLQSYYIDTLKWFSYTFVCNGLFFCNFLRLFFLYVKKVTHLSGNGKNGMLIEKSWKLFQNYQLLLLFT